MDHCFTRQAEITQRPQVRQLQSQESDLEHELQEKTFTSAIIGCSGKGTESRTKRTER